MRVEVHLAQILAFDFAPGVKEEVPRMLAGVVLDASVPRRAPGELPAPFEPIERDLGPAIAAI